jgi:hypothetical protein
MPAVGGAPDHYSVAFKRPGMQFPPAFTLWLKRASVSFLAKPDSQAGCQPERKPDHEHRNRYR